MKSRRREEEEASFNRQAQAECAEDKRGLVPLIVLCYTPRLDRCTTTLLISSLLYSSKYISFFRKSKSHLTSFVADVRQNKNIKPREKGTANKAAWRHEGR
jgi:hypothetical protein